MNKDQRKQVYGTKIEASKLFERVSSDVFGPIEVSKMGLSSTRKKVYVITITDIYSRISQIRFVKVADADNIINSIEEWVGKYGYFEVFISDNGRQYTSKRLAEYFHEKKIKYIRTPIYHPSSNGISERIYRTIGESISIFKGVKVEELVKLIEHKLNENYNRSIGVSPMSLKTGVNFYGPFRRVQSVSKKEVVTDYDKIKNSNIEIGDNVYVKNYLGDKFQSKFIGPYIVEGKSKNGLWFQIENIKDWIHANHLKF